MDFCLLGALLAMKVQCLSMEGAASCIVRKDKLMEVCGCKSPMIRHTYHQNFKVFCISEWVCILLITNEEFKYSIFYELQTYSLIRVPSPDLPPASMKVEFSSSFMRISERQHCTESKWIFHTTEIA